MENKTKKPNKIITTIGAFPHIAAPTINLSIRDNKEEQKLTNNQLQIIELLQAPSNEYLKQNEISEILHIPPRSVRKEIAEINYNKNHKIIILSGNKGFFMPNNKSDVEVEALIKENALKLKKQALKILYRASAIQKKFNLPDKNIWDFMEEVK